MKLLRFVLMMIFGVSLSGCYYSGIDGTVVDSATGKPIEGALVVAQWSKPRGIPGMQYSNLHKITETLTDKKGRFSLSGTIGVLIDSPEMLIYKEGYIPWRNDMIFPGGTDSLTKKHEWNNKAIYKLDVFADNYTVVQLYDFTTYSFMVEGLYKVPKFDKIHGNLETRMLNSYKNK